jgi:hypothetical protein
VRCPVPVEIGGGDGRERRELLAERLEASSETADRSGTDIVPGFALEA